MSIDIVVMQDCASNYGVFAIPGSKGQTYRITLHGSEDRGFCQCKSFEYHANCKHLEMLWKNGACLYNPQWKDGQKNPPYRPIDYTTHLSSTSDKCPACGGPTVAVRRAV